MKKDKPRWKNLPMYESLARRCKQFGASEEMCEHLRNRGKEKEAKEKEAREMEDE